MTQSEVLLLSVRWSISTDKISEGGFQFTNSLRIPRILVVTENCGFRKLLAAVVGSASDLAKRLRSTQASKNEAEVRKPASFVKTDEGGQRVVGFRLRRLPIHSS